MLFVFSTLILPSVQGSNPPALWPAVSYQIEGGEVDMRFSLFSVTLDKEVCRTVQQCHISNYMFLFRKIVTFH